VNVKELAEYAKENNAKVVVTGYADSKTGTAEFNQALSEKRANAVADELVNMGVSRDNIVVEAKGGVDAIAPFSYNRRVTVKLQ
jgi:outer membrane protein OmpA-like peptidoglycan-associated protein